MVSRLEVLVLSIGNCNAAFTPESPAFERCNPLLLKSFARPGKHTTDDSGIRVFPSLLNGLKAAFFDMGLKLKGKSRAGLAPTDKLENLMRVYGVTEPGGQSKVVSFLRRSLKDTNLSKDTPLSFFLEPEDKL